MPTLISSNVAALEIAAVLVGSHVKEHASFHLMYVSSLVSHPPFHLFCANKDIHFTLDLS